MNARIQSLLPAIGHLVGGGVFHGVLLLDGKLYGETSAPKASEIAGLPWMPDYIDVPAAAHDFDGLGNTNAMAEAGSPLAKAVRDLVIDGFNDWYIPARGGLLMQWGNLRPTLPEGEGFEAAWYWSSTQYSRYDAFDQYFGGGDTGYDGKSWEGGRARPVRRFLIE